MREFAAPGSRVATLPLAARVLYTVFAVLVLCGCLSCVGLYDDFIGFDAHSTPRDLYGRLVDHYRPGGPRAIGRRVLLEVTHAHLFVMPLLLLVAGHLFLLTRASRAAKTAGIATASIATVAHLAAPWVLVATAGSSGLGLIYPVSGAALLASFAVMLGVPTWEMWTSHDAANCPPRNG